MEKNERKRSANYSQREKEIIISLVQKYIHVLENKKTNAQFNKQKNECWEKLAWEFNAVQTSGPRTGVQLKSAYEQMKKLAKQHKAEDKVELMKTGGGIFENKTTQMDDKILCLLKDNYFSIDNRFDNNATVTSETILNEQSISKKSVCDYSNFDRNTDILTPENHSENTENIIFIYEEDDPSHSATVSLEKDCETQVKGLTYSTNKRSAESENTNLKSYSETPRKKLKVANKVNTSSLEPNIILNKKVEVLDLKINILKKIEETESENLKGKILDTEIKQIVKEKELIDLKIKKIEYKKISGCSSPL